MPHQPDTGPEKAAYLPAVRAQYEALPYPPRDPAEERLRLIHRTADHLIRINHHCFGGERDFSAGFRVLVAGGGTGDSTIYLAEQLRGFDAEIVHLDFSAASMAVARARAGVRGLDNITWVHASLMRLPQLGLGTFDYINCTGVLHHLESSEAGLAALAGSLAPGGALLLMLYGKYGRRSVYDMQGLLRAYLPADMDMAERVRRARELIAALPSSNSFVRDLDVWRAEIAEDGLGDAGFYDLLLHSRDRCFDVPQLYALTASAGLDILTFIDRSCDYEPASHLRDPELLRHLDGMDEPRRQAIAELLTGDLASHEFYVGHRDINRTASFADDNKAIVLMGKAHGRHRDIGAALAPGRSVTFSGRSGSTTVAGNAVNRVLFSLMDGVTPLAEVFAKVHAAVPGIAPAALREAVGELYRSLEAQGHVCLLQAGDYGKKVPDYSRLPPPQ